MARVWKLGADIDADALAPGRWMTQPLPELARHCLESMWPEFAANVRAGDIIAAGRNFGAGSSREQAAAALKHLGIAAVLAPSFAGIFFRNAINLGLPALVCAEAETLDDGEHVHLDLGNWSVVRADGSTLVVEPLPPFLKRLIDDGGLLAALKQRPKRI